MAQSSRAIQQQTVTVEIPGFAGGLGNVKVYQPGRYAVTSNAITRFGSLLPGLLEEADATGIAAGYRVIKRVRATLSSTLYSVILTTNGTGTKVYHKASSASTWTDITPTSGTEKTDFDNNPATDMVFFLDAGTPRLIVGFGTRVPWYYNTNLTATWIQNGQTTDRSEYMSKVYVQESGLNTSRLIYAVDPDTSLSMGGVELYTLTTVTGAPSAKVTIAPDTSDYCTSIIENDIGDIFIGTRNRLYSFDDVGNPVVVAGPYPDPPANAGGQSDRRNFEIALKLPDGTVMFNYGGYDLVRVKYRAAPEILINEKMAPRWQVDDGPENLPRVNLPISAGVIIAPWIVIALTYSGSGVSLGQQPGGTTLLQNTLTAASELYVGRLTGDGNQIVWYGSELTCTDKLQYLWWEEWSSYLYLASGDAENANQQQRRCTFLLSTTVSLQAGGSVELAPLDAETAYTAKIGGRVSLFGQTQGLSNALSWSYRAVPDHDTSTTFTTGGSYTSAALAERGTYLPRSASFDKLRLRFTLANGTGTTFPRLDRAEVELTPMGARQGVFV